MQWDASQRQYAPLIGAGGMWAICFCAHLPTWGSKQQQEIKPVIFQKAGQVHTILISLLSCLPVFLVQFLLVCEVFQWVSSPEQMWREVCWCLLNFCQEKDLAVKFKIFEVTKTLLGGQSSCFRVCSWIGQTIGTIWNRLWWKKFFPVSGKITAWAAKWGSMEVLANMSSI